MDTLSGGNSFIHRLDPRVKLLTTLAYIIFVVSFDKFDITAMIPFIFYPVFLISAGGLPAGYILKKVLIVSPFALMIAVFNPILNNNIALHIGIIEISEGWISFFSIMLRFFLTVTSVIALITTTGFNAVCMAAEKMGTPKLFAVQLLFLYRYIFVMAEEASRMMRARSLRAFRKKGKGIKQYGPFIGTLLLRTIDRARRIYLAMCCRGFDGNIRISSNMNIGYREIIFTAAWISYFTVSRIFNLPEILGSHIERFPL
jgi:cobalt/nickel transport system permease protein